MQKQEIIDRLLNPGIVAIIRTDKASPLIAVTQALEAGGITAMEVTMTTPNALDTIRKIREESGDRILIGVGTVLDTETCRMAILAGAMFVVTPVLKTDVISLCNRYSIPILCGAYTPTEALTAHEAGADFIKIFPADTLGPKYIKALLAPLPQLRVIPTGGVDQNTIGEFIRAGCVAVAVGSSLVSKAILQNQDWDTLTQKSREMVEAVKTAREGN